MSDEKRKLYEVTVEFTFYAYAENPHRAADFADDALRDSFTSDYTDAREVTHKDWRITGDWDNESLVYHKGRGDIPLGELLEKLPPSVKAFKKEEE